MKNPLSASSSGISGQRREPKAKKTRAAKSGAHSRSLPRTGAIPDLREFTQAFFRLFGATVTPLDRRRHGPLLVSMSGELAGHFGAARLGLAFQSVEAGSGHQLVAHGSRAFDSMLTWLERRSALTVRRLPVRAEGSDLLLRAIRPLNAGVAGLKLGEQQEPLFVFHWRMTYRADDKREELYTVVLDASGALETPGRGELPPLETLLAESEEAPVIASASAHPTGPLPDGDNGESTRASDLPSAAEQDATVAPNGQRLPPMAQLVRLAERARRHAIFHADLRCVEHEAEILPRLYKAVERLSNYYGQQADELPAGSSDKVEALQIDLARKVAEEVENHRLRVFVELCGYAVIYLPTAFAEMRLSDGRCEAHVRVRLDRYTGHLQRPACHACGAPVVGAVLCCNGHVACDGCLRQCGACREVYCAACGTAPCSTCGRELCARCGHSCQACGERACMEHIDRCPTCGDEVCSACQTPCAECGALLCRSHLRAEAVVRAEDGPGPRLICGQCAVRCAGCAQYSARLATCSLSGQRFCANCVVTCNNCKRSAGPGFYLRDGEGQAWCRDCVQTCESCGKPTFDQSPCTECGRGCCGDCTRKCGTCSKCLCPSHAQVAAGCEHVLCRQHAGVCPIGGEVVCTACASPCAVCERTPCSNHSITCTWCRQACCTDCMESGADVCKTCMTAVTEGTPVDLLREPCAANRKVVALARICKWQKAENSRLTIYASVGFTVGILLTVHEGPKGEMLVKESHYDLNALERARRAS